MRTVGVWGVQRGAEAVLNVVRAIVDPMHAAGAGAAGSAAQNMTTNSV
jgi:hypothetical protein